MSRKTAAAKDHYITITPSMYDMLHKAYQNHKGILREEVFKVPRASKTLTALVDKKLLELARDYKTFYVTPRGYALLRMEPRWVGKTEDKFGDTIGTWTLTDFGDHFQQLANNTNNVSPEIDRATPFIEMEDRHVVSSYERARRSHLLTRRTTARVINKICGE